MITNNPKAKVSIHLVTWNSSRHIQACWDGLQSQTYTDLSLLVVDNASVDGTVTWLKEHAPHLPILQNTRNLGFSRAHNQAILLTQAPYILVLNPDVILRPDWIERAVALFDSHPEYAAIGGKTLRFQYTHDDLKEVEESGIIDSTGLVMNRSRYCTDRGAGESDSGQYEQATDVFGISGSCLMLRRTAINEIRWKDEFFDEDFFAYKEDIDLAWRLQRRGWTIRYEPSLVALHHREIRAVSSSNNFFVARNHRNRSQRISYLSLRNHLMMLMKHERAETFVRDGYRIVWQEFKKFFFLLLMQPKSLAGIRDALKRFSVMKQKRLMLEQQAKKTALEVRARHFLSK